MATKKSATQVRSKAPPPPAFPIVGIGASAGGLEAFEAFFTVCPADSGMAFVLVPHLDPSHDSLLTDILQRATAMKVVQALDQVAVAPNHVYVLPPNREMAIFNGVLQLSVPELARGRRMPIDTFLRSLAEDQAERAIGIILSGTATDGTLGLRAILGAGGVCMVQDPATARYDGMPTSAINAGYATHVLPVDEMPAMLRTITHQASLRVPLPSVKPAKVVNGINQILLQLRSSTGHDFSLYKKSTIGRRIERRMAIHAIDDLATYARFLKGNPGETQTLFKELLINVTSFFRDPGAFVALKETILPPMLAGRPEGHVFRVWVAACSSGEEAYSIAIVLLELQDELKARHDQELSFQIYATDLDDDAIATAREGRYLPNIAQDVTPERLGRFFTHDNAGYKIKKEVRDRVVFAVQSIIKDPPFTKLDLLSCRNLLIYLEQEQQQRLIRTFHYALQPGGVLFLSPSESITSQPELFSALDRKWTFYRAVNPGVTIRAQATSYASWSENSQSKPSRSAMTKPRQINVEELTRRVLLQAYAPASVVTDAKGNILYVYGETGRYLRPAPGPASNNVITMAREGLQLDLHNMYLSPPAEGQPAPARDVSVKTNGGFSLVRVSMRLLWQPQELVGAAAVATGAEDATVLLVSFEDVTESEKPPSKPPARRRRGKSAGAAVDPLYVEQLERELALFRENHQAVIEEQQVATDDLKSTNEELQSANEELQSSNEELETAKEELQSLNEELSTVNAELNAKIDQMTDIQNDIKNLMDSSAIGTLFVDHQLLIRRYTPAAVKVYRLIPSDIGRPLADITSSIAGSDLLADLQNVLDTLIPIEREVRTIDGAWYLARMQPYRTLDNNIAGVVLTVTNVTEFKRTSEALLASELARELAEGIVNTVNEPLLVLDSGLQVISAGDAFYRHFQVAPQDTVGRKVYELGDGQWNIPALRKLLEELLPQNKTLERYVLNHDFPGVGPRRMLLNARRIITPGGGSELILLSMTATSVEE